MDTRWIMGSVPHNYWLILWQDRLNPYEPEPVYSRSGYPELFTTRGAAVDFIREQSLLYRQRCWVVPLTAGEPQEVESA